MLMKLYLKQGNRGDMRKIHVTRQFFEASGRHESFFDKIKNTFLDEVNASMCAKYQVCIVFRLARRRDRNKYIHKYTNIQVKLGISSTSCSPHVDFENLNAIIEGRKIKHFLNSLWTSFAGREHFRKISITAVSQNIFEFFRTNLCQGRFFMYTQMVFIAFIITLVGMSKLKYREFEQFLSVNLI